jgi:hypothetical protein
VAAQPDGDAAAALAQALRLDPTLAAEPVRLRRALADLAPHDQRGWLLALGAAVGVPELIGQAQQAEAQARLVDTCGCRPEVAGWVLSGWVLALGGELADGPAHQPAATAPEPDEAPPEGTPAAEPGAPSALRVSVWPDGTPALATVTMHGVFVLPDAGSPARGRWRYAAPLHSPLSRDVALAVGSNQAQVVWTDHDGVRARSLRRSGPSSVNLDGTRLLVSPPDGEQARYPLAALGSGADALSIVWTADRRTLILTEVSGWLPGRATVPLSALCADGERLASLDGCAETERTAWLACRTDRGRLLVAQWDLTVGEVGQWRPLDPPVSPVAIAVACFGGVPFVVAATGNGDLISLDVRIAARGAVSWHSIDRPEPIRSAAPARIIAAAAPDPGEVGKTGWLALAGTTGVRVMPVNRRGDILECGAPSGVWTGG